MQCPPNLVCNHRCKTLNLLQLKSFLLLHSKPGQKCLGSPPHSILHRQVHPIPSCRLQPEPSFNLSPVYPHAHHLCERTLKITLEMLKLCLFILMSLKQGVLSLAIQCTEAFPLKLISVVISGLLYTILSHYSTLLVVVESSKGSE